MTDNNNKEEDLIKPASFEPVKETRSHVSFRPNYRGILIVAGLFFSGWLAWYMVSAKSVYIVTEPVGADISIATPVKLKVGDRYLLHDGSHEIELLLEGYYPVRESIEVNEDDQSQEFSYVLEKLPGHLLVSLNEGLEAEIFIDEENRGKVPATVKNIRPGSHTLRIEAERYLPYEQELEITHQEIADDLNTSRVVVTRMLKKLHDEGRIYSTRSHVRVNDL